VQAQGKPVLSSLRLFKQASQATFPHLDNLDNYGAGNLGLQLLRFCDAGQGVVTAVSWICYDANAVANASEKIYAETEKRKRR